ncbi:MAG: mechanosensitive ion channel domain-containing protein [Gemmatimonadaceae bacterium]
MNSTIRRWLFDPATGQIVAVIIGILLIITGVRIVSRTAGRHIADNDTRYRVRKLVTLGGYIAGALLVTIVYSGRLGGFTVALGVAGAGIAFALQEIIVSIAGWLALTFSNFYSPGDRVQLGGIKGDVIDIGVLRTTIMEIGEWVDGDLYNGRMVRVANSFVFKQPVFNYSGDFPFLWDEIRIPVKYGSDRKQARQICEEVVAEVVGEYTVQSRAAWDRMLRKFRLEEARVDPIVSLIANDNWLQFTIRYVVDYRKRRSTKDALFTKILDRIDASAGKVSIASGTYDLVGMPTVRVELQPTGDPARQPG